MYSESFEVTIKKAPKIKKGKIDIEDEDCSDVTDNEENIMEDDIERNYESGSDEESYEFFELLRKAFDSISTIEKLGLRAFRLDFFNPGKVKLIEEEGDFDFDRIDDIPHLYDADYFIPFVNFLKESYPELTGVTIETNIEGGGSLVI